MSTSDGMDDDVNEKERAKVLLQLTSNNNEDTSEEGDSITMNTKELAVSTTNHNGNEDSGMINVLKGQELAEAEAEPTVTNEQQKVSPLNKLDKVKHAAASAADNGAKMEKKKKADGKTIVVGTGLSINAEYIKDSVVNSGKNNNEETSPSSRTTETTASSSSSSGAPSPPALSRNSNSRRQQSTPGAVEVIPSSSSSREMRIMNNVNDAELGMASAANQHDDDNTNADSIHRSISLDNEYLLNATLVDENNNNDLNNSRMPEQPIVEAEPAPTGLKVILYNRWFKYIAAYFVLVLLAIVIPVALLSPAANSNKSQQPTKSATEAAQDEEEEACGTREINQIDYRGAINTTESGKPCQAWESQQPHTHDYLPESYPDTDLQANYCRNPGGDAKPWCYTTDNQSRWEWCSIPYCDGRGDVLYDDCGTTTLGQWDYRGNISVTATGKPCLPWNGEQAIERGFSADQYPTAGLENSSACRNPDFDSYAWCYIGGNESRYEYCDIPFCEGKAPPENQTCQGDCTIYDCGDEQQKRANYRGYLNTTVTGRSCINWNTQEIHPNNRYSPRIVEEFDLRGNYCRNPDSSGPYCYTNDPDVPTERCNVPYCPARNFVPRRRCGTRHKFHADYRGDVAKTESGEWCVSWDGSAQANELGYTTKESPSAGLVGSYCRNPSGSERDRAWCFVEPTNSSSATWGYCDVEDCQECGTIGRNKTNYLGTESTTIGGLTCVNWVDKQDELVKSNITVDLFYLEGSFCRNPDGVRDNVWCFTDYNSSAWDFCSVPTCSDDSDVFVGALQTCGTPVLNLADYRGAVNQTASGKPCQPWSREGHKYTPDQFPESGLDNNYCRNPGGFEEGAWCFTEGDTTLHSSWELCNVPACQQANDCGTKALNYQDYRGKLSQTASGLPCQRWDEQVPHAHRFDPESYPSAGLSENYCRNPDGAPTAWCFTSDQGKRWEACSIAQCQANSTSL